MGASLTQDHAYFSSGCGFMVGLGKPKMCIKFEVASFSRCRNIKREAPNFGELFLLVGFDDGPWQPQLHVKFEVAGFIYYGNIRESVFKRQIRFLSQLLG